MIGFVWSWLWCGGLLVHVTHFMSRYTSGLCFGISIISPLCYSSGSGFPNIFLYQLIGGIDLYKIAAKTSWTCTIEGSSLCISSRFLVVLGMTYTPAPLSFQLDDIPGAVQRR